MDWVAQIRVGAASVRVHFTGGALTTYGVTPAEYTTSNPFIQKVIENSSYFKEGRIIIQRRTEIKEPKKPAVKAKPKAQAVSQPAPVPQPKVEGPIEEAQVTVEAEVQETAEEAPVAEAEAQAEETAPTGLSKVEVACFQDALAYLQENFNISSYKVRSYEAAQKAASEHGIEFVGAKFEPVNGNEDTEEE